MQNEIFEEITERESNAICMPITVNFTRAEFNRWHDLNRRLRVLNKKAKLAEFARRKLSEMLNGIEEFVVAKEQEIHGQSSSMTSDRDEAS